MVIRQHKIVSQCIIKEYNVTFAQGIQDTLTLHGHVFLTHMPNFLQHIKKLYSNFHEISAQFLHICSLKLSCSHTKIVMNDGNNDKIYIKHTAEVAGSKE